MTDHTRFLAYHIWKWGFWFRILGKGFWFKIDDGIVLFSEREGYHVVRQIGPVKFQMLR